VLPMSKDSLVVVLLYVLAVLRGGQKSQGSESIQFSSRSQFLNCCARRASPQRRSVHPGIWLIKL
jgi:hypothetical protein